MVWRHARTNLPRQPERFVGLYVCRTRCEPELAPPTLEPGWSCVATPVCRTKSDKRAGERTRTSTGIAHQVLNLARLPVPPRPHERNDPDTLLHVSGSESGSPGT